MGWDFSGDLAPRGQPRPRILAPGVRALGSLPPVPWGAWAQGHGAGAAWQLCDREVTITSASQLLLLFSSLPLSLSLSPRAFFFFCFISSSQETHLNAIPFLKHLPHACLMNVRQTR